MGMDDAAFTGCFGIDRFCMAFAWEGVGSVDWCGMGFTTLDGEDCAMGRK